MRVLTMNVQHDQGDPRRTALINAELRRASPDIATFQEVCHPGTQLAELTAGTGLIHTTSQHELIAPVGVGHGTVVATRWPHRVVDVDEHRGDPHWWTVAVAVDVPDGGEQLLIVPTTPWRPEHEQARLQQAHEITALDARHHTASPTVVAGDFNAAPDSPTMSYLLRYYEDAWSATTDAPGYTWTVDNPVAAAEILRLLGETEHRRRIDYILTLAPISAARLIGATPVENIWLSDHYGVLADLR
ncbi:endonuclease/exonuclease/phosphatase family protein [Kribbella ginsengisoli]|uniref:Endonuclease/exonuclease/phosphatase family protein n=1 Tax=Kribbella ginsengisoli TaxID=363865 RepID=A0ABP6Y1H8_9ACTN